MANVTTDKIRQLENKVHLAGALAELGEVIEGKTANGIPYLSFSGAVQCGPEAVSTVRFRSFIKSKKSDGTDSKLYANAKEWLKKAVPMTKNTDKPTMVDLVGSLTDNPFVNNKGELVEGYQYSVQLFGQFKEYAAEIDLEGYIQSIVDETKGPDSDDTTGRQRMRLISRDIFGNTLDINKIVVPKELVRDLSDAGYEKGCTTTIYISLTPNEAPAQVKKGGIGKQRVTNGTAYLEWVMTGASEIIDPDSDKALDRKLIKDAMTERKNRLDELKENGYQGGNSNSTPASTSSRNGIGSKSSTVTMTPIEEDDDLPF